MPVQPWKIYWFFFSFLSKVTNTIFMTIIEIDYILWHTERMLILVRQPWGLQKWKKSFELIMKLMNSLVANEAEVFGGKKKKNSAAAQILRRIKTNFNTLEVLVLWNLFIYLFLWNLFKKLIVMVLKPKAMALTPSIPGQSFWYDLCNLNLKWNQFPFYPNFLNG